MVGMKCMLPTSYLKRIAGLCTLLPPLSLVRGMEYRLPSSSPSSMGPWLCSRLALSMLLGTVCWLPPGPGSKGALLCSLLLLSCSFSRGSWLCRALPA